MHICMWTIHPRPLHKQQKERDLLGFQFPLSPCHWLKWVKCLLTSNASFPTAEGSQIQVQVCVWHPSLGTKGMGVSPARSWVNSEISLWVFFLHWNPHELTQVLQTETNKRTGWFTALPKYNRVNQNALKALFTFHRIWIWPINKAEGQC